MNEEVNVKAIDFSVLPVGEKFFVFRDATDEHTKIVSVKDERGIWSNARNSIGFSCFIKYDARVWIKK